ncbi:MAG TPA: disulfide bond formation protein B [Gaiellaceae bacterium]|nr:disulfide bond formation protein B [Gaiellaceae bacterium]
MTDAGITTLAVLGVIAQALLALLLVAGLLRLAGVHGPWRFVRETLLGSELWLAFGVAAVATGGSLFFSEVAHFVPCKLCWFQRIGMYPLLLLAGPAFLHDRRAARYLLPLPVFGFAVAVWHMLVERGVVSETQSCEISAPGGCSVKWIEEFGYLTIPTLAASAFALLAFLLALAAAEH